MNPLLGRVSCLAIAIVAVALSGTGHAHAVPKADTAELALKSSEAQLAITLDGKAMPHITWTLSSKNPDYGDLGWTGQTGDLQRARLCLVSDSGEACHWLKKGQVGAFVVTYKGKRRHVLIKL
jgi:hypothetical protein